MAMYLYLTKIQRFAYVSRSPLQGAGLFDGLPLVSVSFPNNRRVFFGRGALFRRAGFLLRAAALRAVLHPQLALVQLAFADGEVLECVAVRLFGWVVFKHICAEQLDERAAFLIIEIGKRLIIEGQKGEVLTAFIQPAALARALAVGGEVVRNALPIQLKFGGGVPVDFGLVSVEKIADAAEKLGGLLVVERLDGRIVDVVKSE